MFSKFTNIFQHAVDVLSTNQPQQQDFVQHWKAVTHFFLDKKDHKISIDQTNIPGHLNQMLEILHDEEMLGEEGTGPCMEYMLQHRILETLYTLARTDCPPGMKQEVLQFFSRLLSRSTQPLLPHVNVHKAVHRLIRLCGETAAGPTESEEIQFLCNVCAKLKADPYLVNFFIEFKKKKRAPKSKIAAKDKDAAAAKSAPASASTRPSIPKPVFTLVDSLLSLMHSPDARVGVKACEGLMLAASLPEQSSAHCMVHNTDFCIQLTQQLMALYSKLPKHMDPADIECVEARWGLHILSDAEDHLNFPGKRALISFLSWLDFCDQLVNVAHPIVGHALALHIREHFLQPVMEPAILQASEAGATTATAHLNRCVHLVTSQPLLSELVNFILGMENHENSHILRDRLIQRCDHLSEELSITTLKLFETLLQKQQERIVHSLLLEPLLNRAYVDLTELNKKGNEQNQSNEENESNENSKTVGNTKDHVPNKSSAIDNTGESLGDSAAKCDQENNCQAYESTSSSPNDVESIQNKSDCTHDTKSDTHQSKQDSSVHDASQSDNDRTINHGSPMSAGTGLDNPDGKLVNVVDGPAGDTRSGDTLKNVKSADASGDAHAMQTEESLPDDFSDSAPSSPRAVTETVSIHQIINFFLLLVPEWAKSSHQVADSGYDTYLRDAHRQFIEVSSHCESFNWPTEPVCQAKGDQGSQYVEGALLKVLMDKLAHMLDQSYDVNLQLTAVLSKLAQLPHPNLHEVLLNPYLPTKQGVRTLPLILKKVVHDLQSRLKATNELSKKMLIVRKQLIGFSNNLRSNLKPLGQYTGFEDSNTLEGVIVLEEFCKELAAIAFVKYHAGQS